MNARKTINYTIFIIVLFNVALIAYVFLAPTAPQPKPMPNPNGYDDFVKAQPLLSGDTWNYTTMSREKLAAMVATNAEALKFLENGLTKECRAWEAYSNDTAIQYVLMTRLSAWKTAEGVFCCQAHLAELDGRTNDAIKFYLEGVRFGQECSRSGVFISKMVGVACEARSANQLDGLRMQLDTKQSALIASELEAIDTKAESLEEIEKNEADYASRTSTFPMMVARLIRAKDIREADEKVEAKFRSWDKQRRRIMISFAARAYELDKGTAPANVAQLVPAYLKKIPVDPVTHTNFATIP